MTDAALMGLIHERLDTLLDLVAPRLEQSGQPPLPRPAVRLFEHRLDAGRALPPPERAQPGVIELNRIYLQDAREAMLADTLPHELAHLLVWHLHPGRRLPPHGPLWRQIMREWFAVEPHRTHDFAAARVPARRQRRWSYRCACSEHALTTTRHRRIQGGARYRCRSCGSDLRPD